MQSLWTLTPVHGEITERAANRAAEERGPAAQPTVTSLHSQTTGRPREDGKKDDEGNDRQGPGPAATAVEVPPALQLPGPMPTKLQGTLAEMKAANHELRVSVL